MDNTTKNVLILGVGGTGSHAVDLLYQRLANVGQLSNARIHTIVFDTDAADLEKIKGATVIPMTDNGTIGTVVKNFDAAVLEDWFPCYTDEEAERRGKADGTNYMPLDMSTGANQWRKKSYLAFVNLMNDPIRRSRLENAMRDMKAEGGEKGTYEIYTVASIAGGTGSGSFIPITLYVKKFLESLGIKKVTTNAMLACPDIYKDAIRDPEQQTKINANAYAILKELNAMNHVAYGHNKVTVEGQHVAPIRYKLGHQNDRNIGVLFDSSDEKFWTPDAKPFEQIYLLDLMNGLHSVSAHDSVMANALYTLVGTDIGEAIKSRTNNLATTLTGIDAHNAIYASIATTEVVYPVEAVVDYVAHKKATVSVEGDWLTIYRAAEDEIAGKREQALEAGQPYIMPNGGYADAILHAVADEYRNNPTGTLKDILNRGLKTSVEVDGKYKLVDRMPGYFNKLFKIFRERLNCSEASELVNQTTEGLEGFHADLPTLGMFAGGEKKKANRSDFVDRVKLYNDQLTGYYRNAIEVIRNQKRALVKNILGLGLENCAANRDLSLVYNLFTVDGKYIHPVAAFNLLAELKARIRKETKSFKPWEDIKSFTDIGELEVPDKFFELDEGAGTKKSHASAYTGADRFTKIARDANNAYVEHGGNDAAVDSKQLREDIVAIYSALFAEAHKQIIGVVLTEVETAVDALLAEYRSFFDTFNEGKKGLIQKTERLLHADEETASFTIGATGADKEAAYAAYNKNSNVTEESIRELDHVTGSSVFALAYAAASAKAGDGISGEIKVDGLFEAIVDSYKKEIKKSDFYVTMNNKSVFEVLAEQQLKAGVKASDVPQKVGEILLRAKEKATPSLAVGAGYGSIATEISAILINQTFGKYLYDHQKEFYPGKNFSDADQIVEEFIAKSGINAERRTSASTPAGTAYITRAVYAVRPTDIEKLNEVGSGATYYQSYRTALANMVTKETDMWNPHLGMELHKHGYLPYINPDMEEQYNSKLAKAVLYTLLEGLITYKQIPRGSGRVFWYTENGKSKIMYHMGQPVSEKNLAAFVAWIRERDELVEERAERFDQRVKSGLRALPLLVGSTQALTRRITEDEYVIKPMRENLFVNVPGAAEQKELHLSLIEFANKIRISEETERDCDDGEKILKAGFEVLEAFCFERIGAEDTVARIDVYVQQLRKFLAEFIFDDNTQGYSKDEHEVVEYCRLVLEWANKNGCFLMRDMDGEREVSLAEILKTPEAAMAKRAMDERNKPITFDIPTTLPTETPTDTPVEE